MLSEPSSVSVQREKAKLDIEEPREVDLQLCPSQSKTDLSGSQAEGAVPTTSKAILCHLPGVREQRVAIL